MENALDGSPEKGALENMSGDTKSSDCKISKSPSDYGMSPHISEKPDSIDPRRSTKGDSPMGEDPIRQLLYSNSKTSASSSSGSSTSSTSSTADKQDMQIDPSEQNNRGNGNERTDVTASDPISALSLPQRDIDSRDNHQQGEDSGIESMDTLSEKSPNQGDDPFPNQEKLDRELKDISTPLPSISSPKHMNTLSSTSPPRNNSKMSIHMPQSKTIINQATILSEGIHHSQQEESANIRNKARDIAENNPLKIEVAITSSSKSEAVHVPINVVEQDNVIVEGKKESKTLLKNTVFNEVVVKEEEIKPIDELPISVSNDKDDAIEMFPEATVKSEIPQSTEEDLASKQSTKETAGEETLSKNERIDNLDSSNEDTQKDTANDTNGDCESTTTNVESLPATSTSESKVTSDAKSTDRKVEVETMEDTKAKKDSSDSCDVAINDTKDPSGNKPSPIVGSVELAHPVSSGCSSQIQSKEEASVESRKKSASLEPILENKSPTVVVEEKVLPSPKSGDTNKKGDAGSSEMAGNSSNVNLTSNSTHSSVSVSLIRLPVASDAKKDTISDKKEKESATVDANSSSKTISLASVVATSIAPTNNGVAVTASNGLTTQEEHERSSSSTPEIPMLTSNIELASPSTVANCITLHSAASAMARTSSPILTNGSTGGGIQVHRAGGLNNIPPGAKMVPVKLVSVPGGDGNMPGMRLVRVSPVKSHPSMHQGHQGGITVDGNTLGSVPGTRTVVIKSSMLKSATTAAMAQQAAAHQNATIISTAASNCPSITLPSISTPHQASTVLSAGSASSFSITPNPSPLPPHIVTSQPLSPSLLVNASQNAISAMPPANVLKAVSTSTPPQTPPINNVSEPHLPTATFSISNHHNSSTTVELIPNSGLNPTNLPVHPPNLPISVSLARRSISASVVPVPAMNTISSVAASSSGVTTLLGPSLSITPVEVGNQAGLANNTMPSSKHKSVVEPSKPSPAILNSVLASIGASRSSDPSPMIVTGVSRNHMIGTTVIENPVLVKSPTDIPCVVQTPAAAVTVSLKPKITEALKIDTKVKGQGNQRNPRTTKSPQRHHSNGDDFGGGGSLLRPLLQKEEVMPATVITTHVEVSSASAMTINTSTSASQKGKRRRRHDTGSSTKSDKSDNSVTDPVASASKKSKLTAADAKKSQQHNNSSPAVSPASNKGQAASGSLTNTPKTAAKNARGK